MHMDAASANSMDVENQFKFVSTKIIYTVKLQLNCQVYEHISEKKNVLNKRWV